GRSAASSRRVASWRTTYAGTASSCDRSERQLRRRVTRSSSTSAEVTVLIDGGRTDGSTRRTRNPSGVVVSTRAPDASRSAIQRPTSASVAAASSRYAVDRRAEGGAFREPRRVETRLLRPSGHVSDATASTTASPMSSGNGGGALAIDADPRVDGAH